MDGPAIESAICYQFFSSVAINVVHPDLGQRIAVGGRMCGADSSREAVKDCFQFDELA